jgi:hypothetical protein
VQGSALLVMAADGYTEALEVVVQTLAVILSAAKVGRIVVVVAATAEQIDYNSAVVIRTAGVVGSTVAEFPLGEELMAHVVLRIKILFSVDTALGNRA